MLRQALMTQRLKEAFWHVDHIPRLYCRRLGTKLRRNDGGNLANLLLRIKGSTKTNAMQMYDA